MDWLTANWLWLLLGAGCLLMHFTMHGGHGSHGGGGGSDSGHAGREPGGAERERVDDTSRGDR